MSCTTGCPTQDCESYAACLRNKHARVAYCNTAGGWDYTRQKAWDRELDNYRDARRQGIQPATTQQKDITAAVAISDITGKAYDAGASAA